MTAAEDYRGLRLEKISKILRKLELSEEYLEVLETNPSRDLPYHGNRHQLAVAILAHGGSGHYALPLYERQAIFLAALFHDFDYELDRPESDNIAAAQLAAVAVVRRLNPGIWLRVKALISATEVPRSKSRSLAVGVLQDADLLMVTQPDFESFLAGLLEERPGMVSDPSFPGEAALNTQWARDIYGTAMELQQSGRSILDPREAIAVGSSHHPQTLSSRGFLVDRAILSELEELWAQGFSTAFSCSGDQDGSITPGFYGAPMGGYIAFVAVTPEQELRLQQAAESIGRELEFRTNDRGLFAAIVRFEGSEARGLLRRLLE